MIKSVTSEKLTACLMISILSLSACGKKKAAAGSGTLTLSVKLASGSTLAALEEAKDTNEVITPFSNDHTDTVSFTPTSFKLPIMKISLFKSDYTNEQVLYQCTHATEAECLVDLASQTDLDAISTSAASASVAADTYTYIALATCADGKGGSEATTAKITGTAPSAIASNTYRSSGGVDIAVTAGTAAEATVGNWSCATKYVKLNPTLEVTASSTVKMTVIVDNTFLGYFGTLVSSGMGGCAVNSASSTVGLCVNYPAIMAYIGSTTATTKRYKITHAKASAGALDDAKANAILIVAVDADGNPLSAFGRPFFGDSSASPGRSASDDVNGAYDVLDPAFAGPGWGNSLDMDTWTVNPDKTISFKFGGSLDLKGVSVTSFVIQDTAETGAVTTRDGVDSWFFRATPMP